MLRDDPQDFILSRLVVRLRRPQFREKRIDRIKNRYINYDSEGVVVYWDGKWLLETLNKENVERVGIFVNCGNEKQSIHVSQPENSTRTTQAKAVFSAVQQWRRPKKN